MLKARFWSLTSEANRMPKLRGLTLFLIFFCFRMDAHSQAKTKDLVTVTCSCDDATGKAYAKALSVALASSAHYQEVGLQEGMDKDAIRINIVSLPISSGNDTERPKSALSIVCLHQGTLMHQFIETCDRIPIEECAKQLVTELASWDSSAT
jgi:hypothetical protein